MADSIRTAPALFRLALESDLRRFSSRRKGSAHFLGRVREHLEADSAFLYPFVPEPPEADELVEGAPRVCDVAVIQAFARSENPELPRNQLLAPLRINERLTGVVGVERHKGEFELGTGRVLTRLCSVLARDIARREEDRINRVLDRIKEKVLYELRPRDLVYHVLDGLEQIVDYDHSAALLMFDAEAGLFRIEAERVVWTKGKSRRIGNEIPATPSLVESLEHSSDVIWVERGAEADPGDGEPSSVELFKLADHDEDAKAPRASGVLCAPLHVDGKLLGLLHVTTWKRRAFDGHDRKSVQRFLPAVAVGIRNMKLRASLELQAIQAEQRAGLVTLARAVAHDVNNAIGGILPIAEQAREDLNEEIFEPDTLAKDLDVIIDKARLCKRIFSNMLRLGIERAASGSVDVNRIVEELRPVLTDQAAPRRIAISFELEDDLAPVKFSEEYLERVLWNLVNNAIEAMHGRGGNIRVITRASEGGLLLIVSDDGPGIDAETLENVQEPFFTTKDGGTGLGLSICRSLIWQHGGRLRIRSTPGEGTEVRVSLISATRKQGGK